MTCPHCGCARTFGAGDMATCAECHRFIVPDAPTLRDGLLGWWELEGDAPVDGKTQETDIAVFGRFVPEGDSTLRVEAKAYDPKAAWGETVRRKVGAKPTDVWVTLKAAAAEPREE